MNTQVIQIFRLSVDGYGYAGSVKDVKPPKISEKVENFRGGGMGGEVEVPVGTEMDAMEFTLSEVAPNVLKRFGFVQGADKPFTLRSGIKDDAGKDVAHRYEVGGFLKEVDAGTIEAGKIIERKFSVSPRSFKEFINNELVIHIDHEKGVYVVNGHDKLAQARANAGV